MKRLAIVSTGVAALVTGYLTMGGNQQELHAADHAESPAPVADAPLDITDLYSWMDGDNMVVALMVHPNATDTTFSTTGDYVFNIRATDGASATTDHSVTCTFTGAPATDVSCDFSLGGVDTTVAGAVNTNLTGNNLQVHAGIFDDPFFFNATGFVEVATTVNSVAGDLDFNANGCPTLDGATAATLVTQLGQGTGGAAAANDFAGQNVLGIVISIPKTQINNAGAENVMQIWGSTNTTAGDAATQIDRAGRPAISTALVGRFADPNGGMSRDTYNADENRAGWGAAFTAGIAVQLAIYDALDSTLSN